MSKVNTDPKTGITVGDRVTWWSAIQVPRSGIVAQIQEHDGTCVALVYRGPGLPLSTIPTQFLKVIQEDLGPEVAVTETMIDALDPLVFGDVDLSDQREAW